MTPLLAEVGRRIQDALESPPPGRRAMNIWLDPELYDEFRALVLGDRAPLFEPEGVATVFWHGLAVFKGTANKIIWHKNEVLEQLL